MVKNNFKVAVICTATLLLISACGGGDERVASSETPGLVSTPPGTPPGTGTPLGAVLVPSSSEVSADSFIDELDALNTSRWRVSNWSTGGYFLNAWHPDQLTFQDGRLVIRLEADVKQLTNKSAVSGEYATVKTYKYGVYKARFRVPKTPGTISGFFTYSGPAEGTQHDEIDIEIKGDDPTKMQVNYWYNDVEHPTLISLGFDASAAEHDYAFRWTDKSIQWYVDDKLVHEENGSRGPLPVTAGKIILNHWGAVGALPWSTDYVVSTTPSLMTVERVSFTGNAP